MNNWAGKMEQNTRAKSDISRITVFSVLIVYRLYILLKQVLLQTAIIAKYICIQKHAVKYFVSKKKKKGGGGQNTEKHFEKV